MQSQRPVKPTKLLKELRLSEYYPEKITPQIARKNIQYELKNVYDMPWYFIMQVFELSYSHRENNYWERLKGNISSESEDEKDPNAGWGAGARRQAYSFQDFLAALFLCCDTRCKRLMSQKLQKSHIAVPLLLPDIDCNDLFVLQHSALRGVLDEIDGLNTKAPVVAFMSLDGKYSHTELLNRLVITGNFDTFFDRTKEKQKLNDFNFRKIEWSNAIDVACFKAAKCVECEKESKTYKCKHVFAETLTFLNVYDTYQKGTPQSELACEISDIIVAFVDCNKFDERKIAGIQEKSKQLLLVMTNEDNLSLEVCQSIVTKIQVKKVLLFSKIDGSPLHIDNSKKDVRSAINSRIGELRESSSDSRTLGDILADIKTARIQVDVKLHSEGKIEANKICEQVNEAGATEGNIKEIMIPLQRETWHEWSVKEKEKLSKTPEENEMYDDFQKRMENEQSQIRKRQVQQFLNSSNKAVPLFCSYITQLKGTEREYFVERLATFLDEKQKTIHDLRKRLKEATSKGDVQEEKEKLQEEIENVSFDVMHFFRELGQVFEAFESHQDCLTETFTLNQLSSAAAALFKNGYPIELVDCHARQIPLKFIESVFTDAGKGIKGNIFVFSVIGIQSSGKSTLLNTLFGTKFPTSVGLCTEGVNAQLVPVPSCYENPRYEYILVLDARGLRASDAQEDSKTRDNELATFLLGISDFTLINLKGENKSDIKNILEIVTHALLNIMASNRNVTLKTKCMFVHHNVDAVDAKDKLFEEEEAFKKDLDEVAVSKAKSSGIHKEINKFGDIIEFETRDIKYFPNLWRGTPPDVSINSGYTNKVREVKDYIKQVICASDTPRMKLEMLPHRFRDVWNALQSDDFVLNFVNQLELDTWQTLEKHISTLRYDLSELGGSLIRDITEEIENDPNPECKKENYEDKIKQQMKEKQDEVECKVNNFFNTDDHAKYLTDWKPKVMKSLNELKEKEIEIARSKISSLIHIEKAKAERRTFLCSVEKKAKEKMNAYITQKNIDARHKEEQLRNSFDDFWKPFEKEIEDWKSTFETDVHTVEKIVKQALWGEKELFRKTEEVEALTFGENKEFRITRDEHFETDNEANVCFLQTEISNLTCEISSEVDEKMKTIEDEIFGKDHVILIMYIVMKRFDEWNKKHENVNLTEVYKKQMVKQVIGIAFPYFENMQELYKKKINPSDEIQTSRSDMWILFKSTVSKTDSFRTEVEVFLTNLMKLIVDETLEDEVQKLPRRIREIDPIMRSKSTLKREILIELMKNKSFEDSMSYLDDTKTFVERCLTQYIVSYLNTEETKFSQDLCNKATATLDKLLNIIKNTVVEMKKKNRNYSWDKMIKDLSAEISRVRALDKRIRNTLNQDNSKMMAFYELVVASLPQVKTPLINTCRQHKLKDHEEKIINELSKQLLGCQNRCPFCRVECQFQYAPHPEGECYNTQHLPVGILGYKDRHGKLAVGTCNHYISSSEVYRIQKSTLSLPFGRWIWSFIFSSNESAKADEDVVSFKDYQTVYKDWEIKANKSATASLYWKRFFARNIVKLNERYGVQLISIPKDWKQITYEKAIESIECEFPSA